MLKKLFNWLRTLLRSFKFDNELFEKGMNEIAKQLKIMLEKYPLIHDEVLDKVKNFMQKKFANIKPLYKVIDKAIKNVELQTTDIKVRKINTLIDRYTKEIINFYNDNF